MIGAVGRDALADEALPGLQAAGVELEVERTGTTGIALILVADDGENQIVVIPGANADVRPQSPGGAVLCQLEVPDAVVPAAAEERRFFALNAAPARQVEIEPDLLIVNELEYESVSRGKLVAVTYGAAGAALFEGGREVARADSAARRRGRRHGSRRRVRRVPGRLAARRAFSRGGARPCVRRRGDCGFASRRTTFTA